VFKPIFSNIILPYIYHIFFSLTFLKQNDARECLPLYPVEDFTSWSIPAFAGAFVLTPIFPWINASSNILNFQEKYIN